MAKKVSANGKTKKRTIGIILAAGKGTRMITDLPKVLHEVCGRPMLAFVIDSCRAAGIEHLYIIVGYGKEHVMREFKDASDITWVEQKEQKGTGHAVMCCQPYLKKFDGDCVILCGDGPLIRTETLKELLAKHHHEKSSATLATSILDDPTGYGRIVRDSYGNLQGIVEHSDCTAEQKRIQEVNPSYYCFDWKDLDWALGKITPSNVKKEYYLTDALSVLIQSGKKAIAITAVPPQDVLSINSRHQLAEVSKVMQSRIQDDLMNHGVTIVDPSNTWIDARAYIGQDTVINPFTYIHGRVKIGRNCRVGPFAYLRDGTVLEDDVVLGVFIEVKNSHFGSGTRARHHSYIGDAKVGKQVHIGAGTIFANYDGKTIHETQVGDLSFIGSGATLIAPIEVANDSHIEPGSVIRSEGKESSAKVKKTTSKKPGKSGASQKR
ncbi:MAG: NTP transferase domain-containing protein [Phycisphaerae bacterium]|nr:NTP transferase domain-containing protein [Phycisphaerae bacterium]